MLAVDAHVGDSVAVKIPRYGQVTFFAQANPAVGGGNPMISICVEDEKPLSPEA